MKEIEFSIPDNIPITVINEDEIWARQDEDKLLSVSIRTNQICQIQYPRLQHLSMVHVLSYIVPKLEKKKEIFDNALLAIEQGLSKEENKQIILALINTEISNLMAHLDRIVKSNGCVRLEWIQSRNIQFFPSSIQPSKNDMNFVVPIFCSKNFKLSRFSSWDYAYAEYDFEYEPLRTSKLVGAYLRNLADALQSLISNKKACGATLVIKGRIPHQLLSWLSSKSSLSESSTADIEVIYSIPLKSAKASLNENYWFVLKSGNKYNPRIKKANINLLSGKAIYKAWSTLYKYLVIDDIIKKANQIEDFIAEFWNLFEKFRTPERITPFISSGHKIEWSDSGFDKAIIESKLTDYHEKLLRSTEAKDKNELKKMGAQKKILAIKVLERLKLVSQHLSKHLKQNSFYLDWDAIIYDSIKEKDYRKDEIIGIDSITATILDQMNDFEQLYRQSCIISLRATNENEVELSIGVIEESLIEKYADGTTILEYAILNRVLLSCQTKLTDIQVDKFWGEILKKTSKSHYQLFYNFYGCYSKGSKGDATIFDGIDCQKDGKTKKQKNQAKIIQEYFSQIAADSSKLYLYLDRDQLNRIMSSLKANLDRDGDTAKTFDQSIRDLVNIIEGDSFVSDFSVKSFKDFLPLASNKYYEVGGQHKTKLKDAGMLPYDKKAHFIYFFNTFYKKINVVKFIYIIALTNAGYVVKVARERIECNDPNRPTHSELAKGLGVFYAGEIFFLKSGDKWYLKIINNGSGHYKPSADERLIKVKQIMTKQLSKEISTESVIMLNSLKSVIPLFDDLVDTQLESFSDSYSYIEPAIEMEKAIEESLKYGLKEEKIGPSEISGFSLLDVKGDGNCFYRAVVDQMKIIDYQLLYEVQETTEHHDFLRLKVQGVQFKDREWADDITFNQFIKKFPDLILSVIDTRNPIIGFTCYYLSNEEVIVNTGNDNSLIIPINNKIIRIAATGNHFLSVRSHPAMINGAIHIQFNHIDITQQSLYFAKKGLFFSKLLDQIIIDQRNSNGWMREQYDKKFGITIYRGQSYDNSRLSTNQDNLHLKSVEKNILFSMQINSIQELLKLYLLRKELDSVNNLILVGNFINTIAQKNKIEDKFSSITISLFEEVSHALHHKTNILKLIKMLNDYEILSDTVICLERKQHGNNLGMIDVALLAGLLQNLCDSSKITISEILQKLPIYYDALLYNVAREKGVQIVGIEGKDLRYSKASSFYHQVREEYMVQELIKIIKTNKNIILLVGSAHTNNLIKLLAEQDFRLDNSDFSLGQNLITLKSNRVISAEKLVLPEVSIGLVKVTSFEHRVETTSQPKTENFEYQEIHSYSFFSYIHQFTEQLDLNWQFKKLVHLVDLWKFMSIKEKYGISVSFDIFRESNSNFRKSVLLKLHPDKNPDKQGCNEDFIFVTNLREKFSKTFDVQKYVNDKIQSIQPIIYKANIGFKVFDTAIDVTKLIYVPTIDNAKKVLIDTTYLYSMASGVNGFSVIISGADVACKIYQCEYNQALTQALTTAGYMLIPSAISFVAIPVGFVYGTTLAIYGGYSAINNAYSLCQEYNSVEWQLKSVIAYKDMSEFLANSPLQRIYDFAVSSKHYKVKINAISLEIEKTQIKQQLEVKGEFGNKLYDYIYMLMLKEKYTLLNKVINGELTKEQTEVLKAKHVAITIKEQSYEHCMEIVKLKDMKIDHYYCYNEEQQILDHVLIGENGSYIEILERL